MNSNIPKKFKIWNFSSEQSQVHQKNKSTLGLLFLPNHTSQCMMKEKQHKIKLDFSKFLKNIEKFFP